MKHSTIKKIFDADVGAIGIGTLIIFIAMVLIAGIAASVLIQTSSSLEMQVLRTGSQTTHAVASGILIEGIEGYNSSGGIVRMAVEIKPRAGSPDIDLRNTVIEISDSNIKYVLEYDESTFTKLNETTGDVFTSGFYPADATSFHVIVLQDADGSVTAENPTINFGDHVILAIGDVFSGIAPRTRVFGQVIPEEGSPGIIGFMTPDSYTNAVMDLQ
ncbi:MAG: flagellin [Thermoplasmatota archaeon]